MSGNSKKHLFDDPKNVNRVIYALYALCALSLVADLFVERHVPHPAGSWLAFYCLYGFGACVALVLIAKEMRKYLMRGEDYYDD